MSGGRGARGGKAFGSRQGAALGRGSREAELRTRAFVMGRHSAPAAEARRVACGPRVALGRTARRDCAGVRNSERAPARYAAHENFSRVTVNRWRHAGAQQKPPYTGIPFAPSSPHNSLTLCQQLNRIHYSSLGPFFTFIF